MDGKPFSSGSMAKCAFPYKRSYDPVLPKEPPPANSSLCSMSSRTWFRAMIITSECVTGMQR
jgi:hypothetical protein